MRALPTFCAFLLLATPVFSAEPNVLDGRIFQGTSNYTAYTNGGLIRNVVRKVDTVILGAAENSVETLPNSRWRWHVTVIESYKGSLKPGDKIYVYTQWDEGTPDFKEISGKKGFYFMNLDERHRLKPTDAPTYESSWIDVAPYARYGEPMRNLLRTIPQHELAWLDALLSPSGDRVVANPETEAMDQQERWHGAKQYAADNEDPANPESGLAVPRVGDLYHNHSLLHMRWVSRAELLARKRFWQNCLATHSIPSRDPGYGEMCEGFTFDDNSVCQYSQSIAAILLGSAAQPIPDPISSGPDSTLYQRPVWTRWVPPDQAPLLYKSFIDLQKIAQPAPDEGSWCVMMEDFENGKSHIRHFYVSSRLDIQVRLFYTNELGQDCSSWDEHDARLTQIPDWITHDLKYDPTIWSSPHS
jgi:hypothetical protein